MITRPASRCLLGHTALACKLEKSAVWEAELKQCRPCVAQVTSKPWIINDEAWVAPKLTRHMALDHMHARRGRPARG